jgi:hypothetical protein
MRKVLPWLIIFMLVLLWPAAVQAEGGPGFQLKFFGGAGYHLLDDFSQGLKGWDDEVEASPYSYIEKGGFQPFHLGWDFGVEFGVTLNRRWGIGLGAGAIQTGRESLRESAYKSDKLATYEFYQERLTTRVRAIPLTLCLQLGLFSNNRMNLSAVGGISYYFGTVDWEYRTQNKSSSEFTEENWRGTSGAWGFQGGLELDFNINRKLTFFVEGLGRYARWTDVRGDFQADGTTVKDAFLWYTEWGQFPGLAIDSKEPSGGIYQNVRKAVIDLSGFSVRVGLKVRLAASD